MGNAEQVLKRLKEMLKYVRSDKQAFNKDFVDGYRHAVKDAEVEIKDIKRWTGLD